MLLAVELVTESFRGAEHEDTELASKMVKWKILNCTLICIGKVKDIAIKVAVKTKEHMDPSKWHVVEEETV